MKPAASLVRVVPLIFAVQVAFVVQHRLSGAEYRVYTHGYNLVGDWVLAAIWTAAALAALVRRSGFALVVVCIGTAASLLHGFMLLVATSSTGPHGIGVIFLVAAGIQLVLSVRAAPAFHRAPHAPRHAT